MTEPLKQLFSMLAIFFCVLILAVSFNANKIVKLIRHKPVAQFDSSQENMILEGFDYTHWKKNNGQEIKDYIITADALGFESTSWGMLTFNWLKNMAVYHPTIQFFNHDREYSRIMAGKALVKIPQHDYQEVLSTGTLVFEDNPQIVSSNGRILSCSRLAWQRQDNTIKGSEGCELLSNNKNLQVNDILVNLNLDVIQI